MQKIEKPTAEGWYWMRWETGSRPYGPGGPVVNGHVDLSVIQVFERYGGELVIEQHGSCDNQAVDELLEWAKKQPARVEFWTCPPPDDAKK